MGDVRRIGREDRQIGKRKTALSRYSIAIHVGSIPANKLERKTRFELATLALARRCSTTELLPQHAAPVMGDSRRFAVLERITSYAGGDIASTALNVSRIL